MSDNMISFFELIADSSSFEAAFNKAKANAVEFAAAFKASSASVSADANAMGASIERGIATGGMSRQAANAQIASRLQFYGAPGGSAAAGAAGGGGGLALAAGAQMAAFALIALVGAGSAVLAMTDKMVQSYAAASSEILRNSEAIGMNSADLQTWDKIAQTVGLDSQSMAMDFERFGKNLADGAPALKAAGTSLKDIGVTTTDVGQAILQVADYFHTHTDEAQKAAIATALFGRSGTELIPILDQGSAAVQNYKAQLEAMGAILSQSQLIQGAQAQTAITNLTTAFDVAKQELVGAALPGFTVFFQTLSTVLENNAATWVAIGQTIGNVVMFISGLVAGIAGVDIKTMLAAPTDAGAAYQGLGAGASGAASGMNQAAQSSAAATAAIDEQIRALNDQKRAEDDLLDTQKQALQAQLDTLTDVTDSRRRQGEDLVTYERRLEQLKLQDQIKAIDTQKTNYDRGVSDQVAALEDQKAKVKSAAGAMAADLTAGMNSGMLGLNQSLSTGMTAAQQKILASAHQIGQDIHDIFSGDSSKSAQAAEDLGKRLGGMLLRGFVEGIISASQNNNTILNALPGFELVKLLGSMASKLGLAGGGITSGPVIAGEGGSPEVVLPTNNPSRSLALMEQSGMASLVRGRAGSGSPGAPNLSVHIGTLYNADPSAVAQMVRQLQAEARRRGFALSGGFG